jgi:PKD-like domain
MYVDGPESIKPGETLKLSAHSNINDKCGYTWTVSAGRIASGQYTQQITVDTTELAGHKIVITAEIGDGFGHHMASSHTVQILPR